MRRASKTASITETDRAEVARFTLYVRLVSQAQNAGAPAREAARSIYLDVYGGGDATPPAGHGGGA